VWVTLSVREGMVLTMDGDPFLPELTGRQPQDGSEDDVGQRMHLQRAVGECAVQVDRCRNDRHLSQRDGDERHGPPRDHADTSSTHWVMRSEDVVGPASRERRQPAGAAPRGGCVEPSQPDGSRWPAGPGPSAAAAPPQ
jgi:hypothetical protein